MPDVSAAEESKSASTCRLGRMICPGTCRSQRDRFPPRGFVERGSRCRDGYHGIKVRTNYAHTMLATFPTLQLNAAEVASLAAEEHRKRALNLAEIHEEKVPWLDSTNAASR